MKRYFIAIIFTLCFANPNAARAEVAPPDILADPIIPELQTPHITVALLPQKDFKEFQPLKPIEPPKPARTLGVGANGANTYAKGNCTWYAKSRRPDLPSTLGNADTWFARAKALGWNTGTTPYPDAIGMTKAYMHVVYIEKVNADGSVFISEMNYAGFNKVSTRTAPATEFLYIY